MDGIVGCSLLTRCCSHTAGSWLPASEATPDGVKPSRVKRTARFLSKVIRMNRLESKCVHHHLQHGGHVAHVAGGRVEEEGVFKHLLEIHVHLLRLAILAALAAAAHGAKVHGLGHDGVVRGEGFGVDGRVEWPGKLRGGRWDGRQVW